MKKFLICFVLAMTFTTALFAVKKERIVIDGSTTVGPIAKAFAEYYMIAGDIVRHGGLNYLD